MLQIFILYQIPPKNGKIAVWPNSRVVKSRVVKLK